MPETYSFGIDPVSCHAWNKDRSQVAVSLNSPLVEIYKVGGGKWTLVDTLKGHSQRVTGIDWGAKSNLIVTCAADCNAYVWTRGADNSWAPALVVLRMSRAATCVKWSPLENKFAVGSGARLVAVCYYDKENDWWISKLVKKPIKSTVTCLDWHSNNVLLACGSTDFKARVYSAYVKEADTKPADSNWGDKVGSFGTCLQEFATPSGGWVHAVSFSPTGNKLAWVSHDSSICVADAASGMKLVSVKTEYLPFLATLWTSETSLLVAGFDCEPLLFTHNGQTLSFSSKLDSTGQKQSADAKFSAKFHFKTLDSKGTTDATETTLNSVHQNAVTSLSVHSGAQNKVSKVTSSGVDGLMVTWDIK